MNRTGIFLCAAGVLALVALVAGLPRVVRQSAAPDSVIGPASPSGSGSLKMTGRLSHPFVGLGKSDVFLTVDVSAVEVPGAERAPLNLALVIDRSGSMSGFKLTQAKQAAKQLVSQLKSADRLAIVHFGSDVKSMAGMSATPENKERMISYIEGIWDDGGTNISAGVSTGRDLLLAAKSDFKVNRLILVSDGQPTEGITDGNGLNAIIREVRQHGISVSSIGVGTDFNEDLMQGFAEIGAGAYAFLQDASQLTTIFQKDLNQAGTQVARNVTLSFELPPGVKLGEVLGYKAIAHGSTVLVAMPDFAAAQLERLVAWVVVDGSHSGSAIEVARLKLEYTDLLKNDAVADAATLSAMVTDQNELVMKNRDKDAAVFAARARSAVNTQQAADFLKQGDTGRANQLLQQNAFYFEEAAQVAGPSAVADDVQEQKAMLEDFGNAKNDEGRQAAGKAAKRKARIDFGLKGSTY
jgi:Ca-activated chloride channel family protein